MIAVVEWSACVGISQSSKKNVSINDVLEVSSTGEQHYCKRVDGFSPAGASPAKQSRIVCNMDLLNYRTAGLSTY
jgi:hypothetical protein